MLKTSGQLRLAPIALLATLAVAGSTVLLLFPPEQYSFYPRCPLYEALGVRCPGCGGTRALAALLHGHLAEAIGWNALVVVAAMVAVLATGLYATAVAISPEWTARVLARRWQPPIASAGLLAAGLFTVWRNLH